MSAVVHELKGLLHGPGIVLMPCCFDALSARLVEQGGFPVSFMSGFAVSAARLGLPDTGLISFAEMLDQGRNICDAVSIPIIGDADTGYGNPVNVWRTVESYARAGFAGIMIEDQLAPKRCGHTRGKEVVDRTEALARIKAAADAREQGAEILIMARTDARATLGMDEAIWRMQAFADLGADILFLEAPRSEAEMRRFCDEVPGPKMVNMLEEGETPILPPEHLGEIGYQLAAYPLTLISSAIHAMQESLQYLRQGKTPPRRVDFAAIRELVGFNEYDRILANYYGSDGDP